MKNYNLTPVERKMPWGDKMLVVELGEWGRGRKYRLIPWHVPKGQKLIQIGRTRSGAPKIIHDSKEEGWVTILSGAGCYSRNTYGTCYVPASQKEQVRVYATGMGAFGAAGRVGYWYEYLATVKDNTFIKVRPAGGTRKMDRYWLYFGKDHVFSISEEELDLFCEQKGLLNPSTETLIDLIDLKGGK